jgi:isopentenyl diphosphate isomerase/L-lactate dehydrogenase-like FMN-dependent dehydrogenase
MSLEMQLKEEKEVEIKLRKSKKNRNTLDETNTKLEALKTDFNDCQERANVLKDLNQVRKPD